MSISFLLHLPCVNYQGEPRCSLNSQFEKKIAKKEGEKYIRVLRCAGHLLTSQEWEWVGWLVN